jgi:hypothetical protein
MLTAIKLHNELCVGTTEIDDEAIDWGLSPELPAGQSPIA